VPKAEHLLQAPRSGRIEKRTPITRCGAGDTNEVLVPRLALGQLAVGLLDRLLDQAFDLRVDTLDVLRDARGVERLVVTVGMAALTFRCFASASSMTSRARSTSCAFDSRSV
jgi:hypothetical protein